jgi:hypothetical protein
MQPGKDAFFRSNTCVFKRACIDKIGTEAPSEGVCTERRDSDQVAHYSCKMTGLKHTSLFLAV